MLNYQRVPPYVGNIQMLPSKNRELTKSKSLWRGISTSNKLGHWATTILWVKSNKSWWFNEEKQQIMCLENQQEMISKIGDCIIIAGSDWQHFQRCYQQNKGYDQQWWLCRGRKTPKFSRLQDPSWYFWAQRRWCTSYTLRYTKSHGKPPSE